MSGHGRRSHKRKVEELQDEDHRSSSVAREDRNASDVPETPTILTLTKDDFARLNTLKSDECEEDDTSEVSQEEVHEDGTISQGTMWRGDAAETLDTTTQVFLRCRRESNNENFDCETQTVHFRPLIEDTGGASEGSKRATLATLNLKTVKGEQYSEKGSANAIKKCCIEDCESRSDRTESSVTYLPVPSDENSRKLWTQMLDISQHSKKSSQLYMCSLHLLNPTKLTKTKGRTRKKKTCDMLLAEEAEKIKMGLASGRPKRTPKPNKNYDWAELIPFIKSEPQEEEEVSLESSPGASLQPSGGLAGRRRKQLLSSIKKEDKENERPGEAEELEEMNVCESEPEDYGENVSQPSQLRFPPPKPKGRPPRIRDICTQTDAMRTSTTRQPLREVKVQCNLTAEPLPTCPSCSSVDWQRLEELLADCLPQIERELCDPQVAACIKQVLSNIQTSTHATNFLQVLCGGERDELENSKGIVLVSSQEDLEEVEIENMIHPEVEAPVSGVREITPKVWKRKLPLANVKKEEIDDLEDDADDLGLQAATDLDDEEFTPGHDAQEEDDNEEMDDDEDWNIKNAGDSGIIPVRKRQKRIQTKIKKEPGAEGGASAVCCRWCRRVFFSQPQLAGHKCKGRPVKERRFACNICRKTFSQKISLQYHNVYVHDGERKAACPHCDYRAPDKAKLSVHLRTHSEVRPYVCDTCGGSFKFRSTYRAHVARHTNSGPFVCEYCKKAFMMASELQEHSRIHAVVRPFACQLCGMTFKQKKRLRVHHRAVHLQDKRYVCDICGSSYINNWNLRGHMKTHLHVDNSYTNACELCGSNFRGKAGLAAHMRMRHPETREPRQSFQVLDVGIEPEAIEHSSMEPQAGDVELKMIEVYSCGTCGLLCESLEQLTSHSADQHGVYHVLAS
ncbi:zinc finger and SCAN domain-containing protein 12-like isoform X4 [Penaeus indicus]|uniref:zinc finger and SCAN domain-containing protein 12-like isoform X4 n=1 Tax=Penaeus indicus TaxID=29960 RepID=UPI00300C8926